MPGLKPILPPPVAALPLRHARSSQATRDVVEACVAECDRPEFRRRVSRLVSVTRTLPDIVAALGALALQDELTGLLNRRGLRVMAARRLIPAVRSRPGQLVLIDIDNFKAVNDACGHAVGDLVLVCCAHALREVFSRSAILSRLGGDEFAILTDRHGPRLPSNRLASCASRRSRAAGGPPAISLSIGIATYDPRRPKSLAELYAEADERLYREKRRREGRPG